MNRGSAGIQRGGAEHAENAENAELPEKISSDAFTTEMICPPACPPRPPRSPRSPRLSVEKSS